MTKIFSLLANYFSTVSATDSNYFTYVSSGSVMGFVHYKPQH